MGDEILKEVSRLDYFLRTLDTNNLIRKDYTKCIKWYTKTNICVAMMEFSKENNKFYLNIGNIGW